MTSEKKLDAFYPRFEKRGQALSQKDKWPWMEARREPSVRAEGDVQGAATFLKLDDAGVSRIGDLLCAGVPECDGVPPVWEAEDGGWRMTLRADEVVLSLFFVRDEAGRLAVGFEMLVLPGRLQAKGLLRAALRNAALVFDELSVDYCSAYANFDVGGYAWAKLGAAPLFPDTCRTDLLARLDALTEKGQFDLTQRARLEFLVRESPSDSLMHEVAHATDATGKPLGKVLLLGYKWDALWRIDDSEHRARVMEALK
ncbi:hypothetical protein [Brevundimonas sp.]|uniref:hypothetical protein n=1 Tax=Brevundimonas sp. TaxID=1871086 RepID=UPI002E14005A|nr:hypothetical protein [Brevundimonas sp.]